jgi:hypothetical protein
VRRECPHVEYGRLAPGPPSGAAWPRAPGDLLAELAQVGAPLPGAVETERVERRQHRCRKRREQNRDPVTTLSSSPRGKRPAPPRAA